MRCVVQRVSSARVEVTDSDHVASIGEGLCVLVAVEPDDTDETITWMARKVTHLRVFRDDDDRMNRSVIDIGGRVLLVSQFTLVGDCTGGHRPSFIGAAEPEQARTQYEALARAIEDDHGVPVGTGVFGAAMQVHLVNDGPVTLIIDA